MLSNFSLLEYFDGGGIQLLRLHLDGERGLIKWECTKTEQEVRGGGVGSCVNIRVNLGKVQETFFVVFTGVDYSRL